MNEPDRLISPQAVGQMLGGVSVKTIRRKIAAGKLSGTMPVPSKATEPKLLTA